MCTGPERDAQVMCVRTSQEASVAGAEWARGVRRGQGITGVGVGGWRQLMYKLVDKDSVKWDSVTGF